MNKHGINKLNYNALLGPKQKNKSILIKMQKVEMKC